jgi:hypothetical protein
MVARIFSNEARQTKATDLSILSRRAATDAILAGSVRVLTGLQHDRPLMIEMSPKEISMAVWEATKLEGWLGR